MNYLLRISCLLGLFILCDSSFPSWLNRGRRQSDNESISEEDDETLQTEEVTEETRTFVDLHNDEFCVDVSTYGEVGFEPVIRKKCDTIFVKNCQDKDQQICDDVTEIQCDIVPFTECSMSMNITPFKSYETVSKTFSKKICKEGMDTVQHTKMMPECENVTKQNCITKWETDENGNQVWAGNEACEPVTWRECQLVPRQVDFKVPKIICEEGEPIPYTDLQEAEKEQMTSTMSCEVKHSTNCVPVKNTKCKTIVYQECQEEPLENCEEQEIMIPMQEKEHKKKCLLPDNGAGGPAKPPVPPKPDIEFPDEDANRVGIDEGLIETEETTTEDVPAETTLPPLAAEESRIRISQRIPPPSLETDFRRFRNAPRHGGAHHVRGHIFLDPQFHSKNWQK